MRGKAVVLRATESRTDAFCVRFDRWERSRHLLEAATNYERWTRLSLSQMSCVSYTKRVLLFFLFFSFIQ